MVYGNLNSISDVQEPHTCLLTVSHLYMAKDATRQDDKRVLYSPEIGRFQIFHAATNETWFVHAEAAHQSTICAASIQLPLRKLPTLPLSLDAILQYNDASARQLLTNAKLTQGVEDWHASVPSAVRTRVGKCSEASE